MNEKLEQTTFYMMESIQDGVYRLLEKAMKKCGYSQEYIDLHEDEFSHHAYGSYTRYFHDGKPLFDLCYHCNQNGARIFARGK
jgi:hypothetical protein